MIFLALTPPGSITASSQLGYLDVVTGPDGSYTFSLNTTWSLPTDPIAILSVTFGVSPVGNGAFVLYTASDGNHLQFTTFGGNGFTAESNCPDGKGRAHYFSLSNLRY